MQKESIMDLTGKVKGKVEKKICKDCPTEFEVTPEDQMYYKSKGWITPLRCPECRKKRRELRKEKK